MAEFSIQVNQSLINKTLDQIKSYPYPVISYKRKNFLEAGLEEPQVDMEELFPSAYDDFENLTEEALKVLQEEADSLSDDSDELGVYSSELSNYEPLRHGDLLQAEYDDLTDDEKDELVFLNNQEMMKDSLEMGAIISANYILEKADQHTPELVAEARALVDKEEFTITEILGFGRFFRRVVRAVKRTVRTILRWAARQIRKVIDFGKPILKKLTIVVMKRPTIRVANPIVVNNLQLRVATIRVAIPYRIFRGRERHINFTFNDQVELRTSGKYKISSSALKLYVAPTLDKLALRVRVLGIWFTIGLTKIANMILVALGRFEIYDASDLVTPMQVKDFKYEITDFKPFTSPNGLRLDAFIKVSS